MTGIVAQAFGRTVPAYTIRRGPAFSVPEAAYMLRQREKAVSSSHSDATCLHAIVPHLVDDRCHIRARKIPVRNAAGRTIRRSLHQRVQRLPSCQAAMGGHRPPTALIRLFPDPASESRNLTASHKEKSTWRRVARTGRRCHSSFPPLNAWSYTRARVGRNYK